MTKSTSETRVSNHNSWPLIEPFPCERDFLERMAQKNMQQIFVTANLVANSKDEPFNAAVGHILDALDSLPRRPDAAFDCLYRVIDQNLKIYIQPGAAPMGSLVEKLFLQEPISWTVITETLAKNMPRQTADYAASRALDCFVENNPPHTERMKSRARRSLGATRYLEMKTKYLITNPQHTGMYFLPYKHRRDAGRFMFLLFRSSAAVAKKTTSTVVTKSTLDLSVSANILPAQSKLYALLEVCLATYRHERFHGEAFSPFRSSKATLKTYAHAYYMLIAAYIVILGMLQNQGKGGLAISDVVDAATQSMDNFAQFFGEVLNEQ